MRGKTMKKNREQRRAQRNATLGTATPLSGHTTIAGVRSSQNTIRVAITPDLLPPNLNAAIHAATADAIENIDRSTRAAKAAHREHARLTTQPIDAKHRRSETVIYSWSASSKEEKSIPDGYGHGPGNPTVAIELPQGARPYAKADDPFLDYYDKPVWEMGLRQYDNDALANAAFLHYDDDTLTMKMVEHVQNPEIHPKPPFTRIMLMTAVKERLRWLDRQLRKITWERDQALAELQMSTPTQQQDEQPAPTMPAATTKGVQEAYVPYSSEHTTYLIDPQQAATVVDPGEHHPLR